MSDWNDLELLAAVNDLHDCDDRARCTRIVHDEAMKRVRAARAKYQRLLIKREHEKAKQRAS
jgi:hypothetical protein